MFSASETCKRLLTSFRIGIGTRRDWNASSWQIVTILAMVLTNFIIAKKLERFFSTLGAKIFGSTSPHRISIRTNRFSRHLPFPMTAPRIGSRADLRKRRLERSCSCTFSCTSLATITTAFTRSIWVRAKARIMQRGLPPAVSSSYFQRMFTLSEIQAEQPDVVAIPTGLHHSAQSWPRQRTTLGKRSNIFSNPNGVVSFPRHALMQPFHLSRANRKQPRCVGRQVVKLAAEQRQKVAHGVSRGFASAASASPGGDDRKNFSLLFSYAAPQLFPFDECSHGLRCGLPSPAALRPKIRTRNAFDAVQQFGFRPSDFFRISDFRFQIFSYA